jgi:6-phosphogluconolactonase (cycloisomerase 2 family)
VDLAMSPDGARLYVLSQGADNEVPADALLTYARDAASGQITLVDSERDGVAGVQGLTFPNALAVAPGGAHVYTVAGYAGSQGSILGRLAVFVRSPVDASTSYLGLWADNANGVDGLGYAIGIATTADGRYVLATGAADDALAVFRRNAVTGLLTFERVISDDASRPLDGAIDVAADPLGRFVYVVSLNEDSLTVFAPEPGAAAGAVALATLVTLVRLTAGTVLAVNYPANPKRP